MVRGVPGSACNRMKNFRLRTMTEEILAFILTVSIGPKAKMASHRPEIRKLSLICRSSGTHSSLGLALTLRVTGTSAR